MRQDIYIRALLVGAVIGLGIAIYAQTASPAEPVEFEPDAVVVILGASISWGCVGHCDPEQDAPGYVPLWRELDPHLAIHTAAWFGAGVSDYDPASAPVLDVGLEFPHGLWELGQGHYENLWQLMGRPMILRHEPDYVVVMLGLGDALRPARQPPRAPTSPEHYEKGLRRLARHIKRLGAVPVLAVDAPFAGSFTGADSLLDEYRRAVRRVCRHPGTLCGPVLPYWIDRDAHYVGTDGVHPNADGAEAIAAAFSDTFRRLRR
jgi:hypothetical protein